MIGLAGAPREPSAAWQAAHTWVDSAWPLAVSTLGGALESWAKTGNASEAANNRVKGDFMRSTSGQVLERCGTEQTREFYNGR